MGPQRVNSQTFYHRVIGSTPFVLSPKLPPVLCKSEQTSTVTRKPTTPTRTIGSTPQLTPLRILLPLSETLIYHWNSSLISSSFVLSSTVSNFFRRDFPDGVSSILPLTLRNQFPVQPLYSCPLSPSCLKGLLPLLKDPRVSNPDSVQTPGLTTRRPPFLCIVSMTHSGRLTPRGKPCRFRERGSRHSLLFVPPVTEVRDVQSVTSTRQKVPPQKSVVCGRGLPNFSFDSVC